MKFKKTAAVIAGAVILSAAAVGAEGISVIVNGSALDFTGDQAPVIVNDRTLVPVRAIFEALGAEVQWDAETQTVAALKGDNTTLLQIGSKTIFVDGVAQEIDVPAQIIGDRTMVPVRAVSEAFSCEVGWDAATYTVIVNAPQNTEIANPITFYDSMDELNAALDMFSVAALSNTDYVPESFAVYNLEGGQLASVKYKNGLAEAEVRVTLMEIAPSGIYGGEKIDSVNIAGKDFDILRYNDTIYCDFTFDDPAGASYSMSVSASGLSSTEEFVALLADAAEVLPRG